jgi:hypothetical protein
MPTITIPWCSSGSIIETSVVSWPPCIVEVDENTAAGLPASVPRAHSGPRPSMKYLRGACHVAEARGRSQGDPGALLEVAALDVGRALGRNRGLASLDHGRHLGHRAHARAHSLDAVDAARNRLRQRAHRARGAVIEDEDVGMLITF